ncbi:DUF2207 domain-containing protein [Candidatus Peregrinibacteria bacterium]|nr:DUF2207 domain-containing protein [Candidatus Peregrinibacteria bacterium]
MSFLKKAGTFLLFSLLLSSNIALAETIKNWTIESFYSDIYLNADSSADITETIVTDFSKESHHGIERDIPYLFNNNRSTPIKLKEAIDEKGQSWKINQFKEDGYLKVQMTTMDNHLMNGPATFIIKYHLDDIITFFDDHDEFYWNVNGNDWDVTNKTTNATIRLPAALNDALKIACFTGEYGSKESNCDYKKTDDKTIQVNSSNIFQPYEGLTAVIGFPKNIFIQPSIQQKILWFLLENKIIFLPILVFLVMFFLWYKYGRDDQSVSDTIVPTFIPPKDLSPTETGTIIDEKLDPRDITACIIDYAVRGYIKITELEKPGLFGKKKDYELQLIKPCLLEKDFEKKIILGIFNTNKAGQKKKTSALENSFYVHVSGIKDSVMKRLVENDFFPTDPETTRATYNFIGFGTIFVVFFIIQLGSAITIFSLGLSGLIVAGFGAIMPKKTRKGTETYYQLKGLYEYINTAEKDRMKFQEKNNILFEKLLPYAMAFGIIDKWTKAFDGILKEPPSWYYPIGSGNFTMIYFANSLSNFSSSATQNLTTRPGGRGGGGAWSGGSGFGGGGFSGGGFGGGGGHGL